MALENEISKYEKNLLKAKKNYDDVCNGGDAGTVQQAKIDIYEEILRDLKAAKKRIDEDMMMASLHGGN